MIITLKQEIADLKLQIDKIRKEYESELTNKNSNSKNVIMIILKILLQ